MPVVKHSLRDLARQIEEVAREHPAWSQAHEIVLGCTNTLALLARVHEINQDEARPVQILEFDYVNYKNEKSHRTVNPISIRFGTSEWYQDPQLLLTCFDLLKKDRREFAVAKMSNISQMDRS